MGNCKSCKSCNKDDEETTFDYIVRLWGENSYVCDPYSESWMSYHGYY